MPKNTSPKRVARYRGRRHRAYKFEVRSAFVSHQRLHDALCVSSTLEEHLFVDHRRDDAERHVQGYLRTTRGSKLTEREAVARIAAAGIPPELIRVAPLVGRNAVEAFAHYLTHVNEMLKARYDREEFFASDPEGIWARVDAWLARKARADEASDTEALIERLRQQLMDGEIALYDVQLDYPNLWRAYPGKFKGIENLRENARKEREFAEELREHLRQEQARRAPAGESTVLAAPVDVGAREERDRERREAEDRALAEAAERFAAEREREHVLDVEQAERDSKFDRARELRGLMDSREVELRKQADLDGLDAEALEDLLFEDETLNQYETELRALVPM
ncbi:hypothetical protein [Leucobacter luti]|uniref:Uncharacterized protein n=1 Tax=Leucobacter luti TaxID=340320 RepID=A0A4Q7TIS0_9MICO|nr:hypothetical protein [Leucobacter luti]MBL3700353.1 hypothetical protein [Leucobacter luti]RZT60521.1 hypothetical protein EV139_2966 [Leucobacter luti]